MVSACGQCVWSVRVVSACGQCVWSVRVPQPCLTASRWRAPLGPPSDPPRTSPAYTRASYYVMARPPCTFGREYAGRYVVGLHDIVYFVIAGNIISNFCYITFIMYFVNPVNLTESRHIGQVWLLGGSWLNCVLHQARCTCCLCFICISLYICVLKMLQDKLIIRPTIKDRNTLGLGLYM